MKICVELFSSAFAADGRSSGDSLRRDRLASALVRVREVPCCQVMLLVLGDADDPDRAWTHKLPGDLTVRLHDHTNLKGDGDYVLAHHDTKVKGRFGVFPRGARFNGPDITHSYVQFRPVVASPVDGEGEALSRMYALHVDGVLAGEVVSSTQFIKFYHQPSPARRQLHCHLPAGKPPHDPDFSYACRLRPGGILSMEISDNYLPDCPWSKNFYPEVDVERHHAIEGTRLRSGKRTKQHARSRSAFIRDLEGRWERTLPPHPTRARYFPGW